MKVLHILSDGPTPLSTKIMDTQSKGNVIKLIDLSKKDVPYETVVDEIFSNDRVILW